MLLLPHVGCDKIAPPGPRRLLKMHGIHMRASIVEAVWLVYETLGVSLPLASTAAMVSINAAGIGAKNVSIMSVICAS